MSLELRTVLQEAGFNLLQELSEVQLIGPRSRLCLATALSVSAAVLLALMIHLDEVWWAATSGFMCSQATAPASVQKGILRIMGTLAGAGFGMLISPWLAEDTVALSLALVAFSTLGVLGFLVSPHGYAWFLGMVTTVIVLMALLSDPSSALTVGADRTAEVTIGTIAAMTVAILMGRDADGTAAATPPGWSDLTGAQWPAVRHALQAGFTVLLVPLVWNWLALPSLAQTTVTVAAVMAVPALSHDLAADQKKIITRSIHRVLGCAAGGLAGLACLALSVEDFLPWLMMLTAGIWVAAHIQASERGIGYVGTQSAIVLISTLVQGPGPPDSILPGIERFAGIMGGMLILLTVLIVTTPGPEDERVAAKR